MNIFRNTVEASVKSFDCSHFNNIHKCCNWRRNIFLYYISKISCFQRIKPWPLSLHLNWTNFKVYFCIFSLSIIGGKKNFCVLNFIQMYIFLLFRSTILVPLFLFLISEFAVKNVKNCWKKYQAIHPNSVFICILVSHILLFFNYELRFVISDVKNV